MDTLIYILAGMTIERWLVALSALVERILVRNKK